jgi:hypothetical protein
VRNKKLEGSALPSGNKKTTLIGEWFDFVRCPPFPSAGITRIRLSVSPTAIGQGISQPGLSKLPQGNIFICLSMGVQYHRSVRIQNLMNLYIQGEF